MTRGRRVLRIASGALPFGAILLDLDGCLIDSNDAHARAWSRALRRFGHGVAAARIRPHIGKGGSELLRDFLPPATRHYLGDAIGREQTRLFLARFDREVRPFPGVARTVRRILRAGIRVVVASSADRQVVVRALSKLRLLRAIDGFTTSSDVAKAKPFDDVFSLAIDRFRLSKRRPVAVGDTPFDVGAAHQIGLACIALRSGGASSKSLAAADATFPDLADMWAAGRELFR